MTKHLIVALALSTSTAALATPRPARDTADVLAPGHGSVGVFNPLRIGVANRLELEAHPLVFFVAPHVTARVALYESKDTAGAPIGVSVTAEAGVSLPTLGMRLTSGYLFPSWETSDNRVGWMLVPRVGLLLSDHVFTADVWTVRADAAFRLPLGPNSAAPLDSFLAPLEVLLAAPLTGLCTHLGGAYDKALGQRLRLRGEFNVYVTGARGHLFVGGVDMGPLEQLNPVILTAHLGLDIAVFEQGRVTVGVLWGNYDQGETKVVPDADGFSKRERVRSNNVLPTVDYIWGF